MADNVVRFGIIGGGLMGREIASALGRWFALVDAPVRAELVAVSSRQEAQREWFRRVPTVRTFVADYRELLKRDDVDAVYVAVPHDVHEQVYTDVLAAGKDLLAEKPFGIDLAAARAIRDAAVRHKRFVRANSQMPYYPGAQRVISLIKSGNFGRPIEMRAGFLHSSDLDPNKPVNWKRQTKHCGRVGVLGDLAPHSLQIPLRLGLRPQRVYAQLWKVYHQRPDGRGGVAEVDTWDNAMLHTDVAVKDATIPMTIEAKRLAPGQTNNWYVEFHGTDGGARFSVADPRTLWLFSRGKEQQWQQVQLGNQVVFPTVTGGIFEVGFSDVILQMLAAFCFERAGALGGRFGLVTPDEAVQMHEVFAAALKSHETHAAVAL
jgi:predicted dehydrogenase